MSSRNAPISQATAPWHAPVSRGISMYVVPGAIIILVAIVGFGWWAVTAPLSSAAVAHGTFVATGQNKFIQHLEGGIVRRILVSEGDQVVPGQTLIELDDTAARADVNRLELRRFTLRTILARLNAERLGKDLVFPADLVGAATTPTRKDLMDIQTAEFEARRAGVADEIAIIETRISAIHEEIDGLSALQVSNAAQIDLTAQELETAEGLLKKGLIEKPRVLQLQRSLAELQGEKASYTANIGQAKQRISEAEGQKTRVASKVREDAVAQYRDLQSELDDIEEQFATAKDILNRKKIVAPVAGVVVRLNFHATGAVIAPGDPILELLPTDEQLLIEAHIRPQDIDSVYNGLDAQVRLTALNQRSVPMIEGKLIYVSADALRQPNSDEVFYLARVQVDPETFHRNEELKVSPGMPAEVYIQTGERTFLDYILGPIQNSINKSFLEE